jgi:general secretion pathway protein C
MKESAKAYTLFLVALLTLSAYFLADTVDAMISRSLSAAPKYTSPLASEQAGIAPRKELSDYSSILERGLFGEGKAPSAGGGPVAAESSVYTLIGTVEGASFSGAVLQDSSNAQVFYRRNETLPDGSQIVKVMRDRVTLRQADGSTIDLQVVDDTKIVNVASRTPTAAARGGVRQVADDKFVVDQREVASSTENLSKILTQARALPFLEDGKTVGFRISEIVPGSIYDKIGLQNGDVIQRVNSEDVSDPGKFFQMYQGLKDERHITIDLLRSGQRQTLNYDIR